jgi:hypothetical protein
MDGVGATENGPQEELFWKKKHENLVDKIRNVEERMKTVVFKLKSESLEQRREAEIWKMKFISLRKEMQDLEVGLPGDSWADDSLFYSGSEEDAEKRVSPSKTNPRAGLDKAQNSTALLATMAAGQNFKRFTSTHKDMILVQFTEIPPTPQKKLDGAFVWSTGGRGKGRLTLSSITDIYLGKQTGVFSEPIAEHANPNLCVSLVGLEDELNLEALTGQVLTAWLTGVQGLLELHGKKAVLAPGEKGHYKVMDSSEYARLYPAGAPKGADLSPEAAIEMMRRGQIFGGLTDDGTSQLVMVTFDPTLGPCGGFRCANLQGHPVAPPMPLHVVSEIRLGKQSQAFKNAEHLADDKCFSLYSAERNSWLNLYSEDEKQIYRWLFGINCVIKDQGVSMKLGEDSSQVSYTPNPVEDDDQDFYHNSDSPSSAVLTMCNGADFILYNLSSKRDVAPSAAFAFLFFQPTQGKFGTLYWCRLGTREELPNQSLPLNSLTDIFADNAAFRRLPLPPEQRACCFSLIGRRVSLHLRAQTRKQAQQWLAGVRHVLAESGQTVAHKTTSPEKPRFPRSPERPKPRRPSWSPRSSIASLAASTSGTTTGGSMLSFMQEGRYFRLHDSSPRSPHLVLLRYVADSPFGHLTWTIDKQTFSLDVGAISKILHGRFRGCQVSSEVPDRLVLRLVVPAEAQSLHLSADSETDLLAWAKGLQEMLTTGGAQCFNLKVSPIPGQEGALPTCITVLISPLAGEIGSTQWLRAGVPFLWCGSATQQELVRLVFVDSSTPPGMIAWRTSHAKHTIALRDVTDMVVGRAAHEFEGTGDAACSLSIIGKHDRFDGIAPSPSVLQAWINALSRVLSSAIYEPGELDDMQRRIMQGVAFTRFSSRDPPEPLTVFFEPSDAGPGVIFWCGVGQRIKVEEQSLVLDTSVDISTGKTHPSFQCPEAAALTPKMCISIVAKHTELHCAAASEQALSDWVTGLTRFLAAQGRYNKEKHSDTASTT